MAVDAVLSSQALVAMVTRIIVPRWVFRIVNYGVHIGCATDHLRLDLQIKLICFCLSTARHQTTWLEGSRPAETPDPGDTAQLCKSHGSRRHLPAKGVKPIKAPKAAKDKQRLQRELATLQAEARYSATSSRSGAASSDSGD